MYTVLFLPFLHCLQPNPPVSTETRPLQVATCHFSVSAHASTLRDSAASMVPACHSSPSDSKATSGPSPGPAGTTTGAAPRLKAEPSPAFYQRAWKDRKRSHSRDRSLRPELLYEISARTWNFGPSKSPNSCRWCCQKHAGSRSTRVSMRTSEGQCCPRLALHSSCSTQFSKLQRVLRDPAGFPQSSFASERRWGSFAPRQGGSDPARCCLAPCLQNADEAYPDYPRFIWRNTFLLYRDLNLLKMTFGQFWRVRQSSNYWCYVKSQNSAGCPFPIYGKHRCRYCKSHMCTYKHIRTHTRSYIGIFTK